MSSPSLQAVVSTVSLNRGPGTKALLVPVAPVKGVHLERERTGPVSNKLSLHKDQCKKNYRQHKIEKNRNQVKGEEGGKKTSGKDKEGRNTRRPSGV